jgi:hypothetical protein
MSSLSILVYDFCFDTVSGTVLLGVFIGRGTKPSPESKRGERRTGAQQLGQRFGREKEQIIRRYAGLDVERKRDS